MPAALNARALVTTNIIGLVIVRLLQLSSINGGAIGEKWNFFASRTRHATVACTLQAIHDYSYDPHSLITGNYFICIVISDMYNLHSLIDITLQGECSCNFTFSAASKNVIP
jgi:hypothetical protein